MHRSTPAAAPGLAAAAISGGAQSADSQPPELRLRSLAKVAQYLDLDERSVRRYINQGHLKAYRLGTGPRATIRVDLNEVENFVVPADRHEVAV